MHTAAAAIGRHGSPWVRPRAASLHLGTVNNSTRVASQQRCYDPSLAWRRPLGAGRTLLLGTRLCPTHVISIQYRQIHSGPARNGHDTLERPPISKSKVLETLAANTSKAKVGSVTQPATESDIAEKLDSNRTEDGDVGKGAPKEDDQTKRDDVSTTEATLIKENARPKVSKVVKIKENMNGRIREYRIDADENLTFGWKSLPTTKAAWTRSQSVQKVSMWFRSMFLPIGYPDSVHRTYLKVHQWHFFENIVAGCIIVLCSQSMLESVGIGSAAATGAAVGIMWVLKDSIGEIGKMFFIQQFANSFDSHPKIWKLLGEFAFLIGSFLQLATIIAPSSQFLLLASSGYCLKSIHFAIWGAAHTTFTRAFALRGNVGDLVGKHESQYSLAQIAGSLLGVVFIYLSHAPAFLFSIFAALSPIHIYLTVSLLKATQFEILNTTSLPLLAREYLRTGKIVSNTSLHKYEKWFGEYIKSSEDVVNVKLGIPMRYAFKNGTSCVKALKVLRNERYLFYPDTFLDVKSVDNQGKTTASSVENKSNHNENSLISTSIKKLYTQTKEVPQINIVLHEQAAQDDIIRAYLHAARFYFEVKQDLEAATEGKRSVDEIFVSSYQWVVENFDEYLEGLESMGWDVDVVYWNDKGYRVLWDPQDPNAPPTTSDLKKLENN